MRQLVWSEHRGSADYAESRGYPTRTLVCEVPYFYDRRIDATSPTGICRRDAIVSATDGAMCFAGEVEAILAAVGDRGGDSPFRRAVTSFMQQGRQSAAAERRWAEATLDPALPAAVAQAFDSAVVSRFYRLLMLGMLVRMIAAGDPVRSKAEVLFERHRTEIEAALPDYQTIPIRKLVGVQLASAVVMAEHIRGDSCA